MATQAERTVVYAAGVVQGIALVTFPAASTILTDPSEYDLSNTQYGALFLPQVVTAITASLLGASLGGRFGVKRVYLVGLVASLVAMSLLLTSAFVTDEKSLAYALLLLATASLGAGFGFTVPALNTMTAAFNPGAVEQIDPRAQRAARAGNGARADLRGGVRRPRRMVGACRCLSAILLVALIVVSMRLPLHVELRARDASARGRHPVALLDLRAASPSSTASARRSTATGHSST